MKKALIITYYWPPSGGAGVQRWLKFVKYLRHFHWEPILYIPLNPEYPEQDHSLEQDLPDNLTILRKPIWEPYGLYKKVIGREKGEKINAAFLSEKKPNPWLEFLSVWIRGNLFIPDARKYWIKPSVKFLINYLSANPVDVIISTGPPHSMHLIAMQLSKRLHLPWLADFRDPWTHIDFYEDLKLTCIADRKHRSLERQVLQKATAVTVISNTMAEDFNHIVLRSYDVITNGFDEDDIPAEPDCQTLTRLDPAFSIAHIGTLTSTRNPDTLWRALNRLLPSVPGLKENLEIKLVGKIDYTVTESIEAYGLSPYVVRIPYLPHDQVVTIQRTAQVLLLIINNTPNARMILTGKFFEYLGARRPILCLGPVDGDAAALLQETNAGLISEHGDCPSLEQHILKFYQNYREGTLGSETTYIENYSRKKLTERLGRVLDRIS